MNSRISVTRADVDHLYDMAFSRNMEKSAQLKETGIGALGGAGLGALLGYLTPRDKDEDKLGRYLRYILGGAAMGGLAGLGYGSSKNMFGDDVQGAAAGTQVDETKVDPAKMGWLERRFHTLVNQPASETGWEAAKAGGRGFGTYFGMKLPRAVQEYRNSSWRLGGKKSPHRVSMSIVDSNGKELNPFRTGTHDPATMTLTPEKTLPEPIEQSVAEGSKIKRLAAARNTGKKGLDLIRALETDGAVKPGTASIIERGLKKSNKTVRAAAKRRLARELQNVNNASKYVKNVGKLRGAMEFEDLRGGKGTAKAISRGARYGGLLTALLPIIFGGGGESTTSDRM